MQNRKASAPAWSKVIFVILYIAAVVSVVLYAAIHGNQQFGWGIPFAQWAELYGLQALYQEILKPTGLLYFVAIPFIVTLFWEIIVLLLKLSAKKRLSKEQEQQAEEEIPSVSPEQADEPEKLPEAEETVCSEPALTAMEKEASPEQESLAEPASEPETVPVMAKRLSAEEIREMYRKSLSVNQESESKDPFAYLSELYYQDREEKY